MHAHWGGRRRVRRRQGGGKVVARGWGSGELRVVPWLGAGKGSIGVPGGAGDSQRRSRRKCGMPMGWGEGRLHPLAQSPHWDEAANAGRRQCISEAAAAAPCRWSHCCFAAASPLVPPGAWRKVTGVSSGTAPARALRLQIRPRGLPVGGDAFPTAECPNAVRLCIHPAFPLFEFRTATSWARRGPRGAYSYLHVCGCANMRCSPISGIYCFAYWRWC
ncbi:uncharacterized protein Tco025E_08373, partial [Trypanosoma conorhini]